MFLMLWKFLTWGDIPYILFSEKNVKELQECHNITFLHSTGKKKKKTEEHIHRSINSNYLWMVTIMLIFILFICISFSFLKCLLLFSHSVMSNSIATPWIVTHQAPRSMGFPRQEDWSGLLFPSPGDLSNIGIIGIEPNSPAWQGDYRRTTREAKKMHTFTKR